MECSRFKFRVWSEKLNRYYYNYAINVDGDLVPWMSDHKEDVDGNITIEQCTGLKDKNGKLIYEGDVVLALESWSDRKREFNVIYCDKEYGFLFVDGFKNTKALFAFLPEELEIVGNIHEMESKND